MALQIEKVLISDEIDPQCVEILKKGGVDAVLKTKLSKEELLAEIKNYDGLIVRSATKVTSEVINAGNRLKIIGRAGTGVDNIDIPAATKKGVIVMNTPGGNTISAAEHTCALLMAMSRHISHGTESLHQGRWDRKKLMGNEVKGKTLGIIGLGKIGREVALRMQAFEMTTIGFDPIIPGEVSAEFNTQWMTLEELWPKCDYITVHTPLIPQTRNLINADVFKKCKKGMRVINCARGGIINEEELLQAMNEGQCGGAALDVFVEEPPTNKALINHPLVTCTPHLGASTHEAQSRVAVEIAEQFLDAKSGESLFGAINAHALSNALSEETRPWVKLGSALGALGAALHGTVDSNTQVQVTTHGNGLEKAGSYLGAAVLVGLLRGGSASKLNLVSAPSSAKELGIQVKSEHKSETPNGNPRLVCITLQQPGGTITTLGGIVGGGNPLLVSINGTTLVQGVNLQGNLLVYKNENNGKGLAEFTGFLHEAEISVLSFASSQSSEKTAWNIMHVTPAVPDLGVLKSQVSFVTQIEL